MAENVLYCAGCNVRYRVKSYDAQRRYALRIQNYRRFGFRRSGRRLRSP